MGLLRLTGESEKRGSWGQDQGVSLGRAASLHCSPAPESHGSLRVLEMNVCWGRRGGRERGGCDLRRESERWVLPP